MRSRGASFSTLTIACVTLAGCVGSSSGIGSTGLDDASELLASDVAEQATTTLAPDRNVDLVNVDPVRAALAFLQKTDPSLGTLLRPQDGLGIEECAAEAVPHVLDKERLDEVVTEEGMIDIDKLVLGERKALGQEIGPCHQDTDLLHRLVSLEDFQLADCIVNKLVDLDRTPDVIAGLLAGMPIEPTAPVVGFRHDCQAHDLDDRFGGHVGGTAGEDLRLMSELLVDSLMPSFETSAFERTCLVRGTMVSTPVEWVWEVRDQSAQPRLHPADYLVTSTDSAIANGVWEGMRSALFQCVEPFKLYAELVGLDQIVSASTVGCLRDGLTIGDLNILNGNTLFSLRGQGTEIKRLPDRLIEVVSDCGLDSVPL